MAFPAPQNLTVYPYFAAAPLLHSSNSFLVLQDHELLACVKKVPITSGSRGQQAGCWQAGQATAEPAKGGHQQMHQQISATTDVR